ncbi:MAG: hypothetical protein HRT87_08780 [Legionellales bacterium]|nr:hypothetical protein [Legionellales bacterium]
MLLHFSMSKSNFLRILVLLISLQYLTSYSYSPRIDAEYKGGNKRHIGRYGTLIPLYEAKSSLLFTNMFLMHDSKSSVEGNFGVGFRRQLTNYSILGIYGFWDIRKIKNVTKKIHQGTFGLEYLRERFESRFNIYLPQNKRFLVEDLDVVTFRRNFDPQLGQTIQTIGKGSRYEVPLAGFDIEIGGNIFKMLETHVAYYHFNGRKDAKSIGGWRFRSALYLFSRDNQRLDIQGELNYDNVRKWSNYLGFKFTWAFGSNNNQVKRNSIHDKMTQMTVRDVDAVSNTTPVLVENKIESFAGYSPLVLSDEDQANLKNAKYSGDAVFLSMDTFEQEVIDKGTHPDAIDRMVVLSIDPTTKEIGFTPLLKTSGGVNIVATEKINKLFSSKAQGSKILKSTTKTKDALVQSLRQKDLDGQLITTVGEIAIDLDVDFWERNINVLLYQDGFRLATGNIRNVKCAVYNRNDYPIPLILTDPADRALGFPEDIPLSMKLSNTLIDKLPVEIKDKIILENGDLNNIEIYYILQNVKFSSDTTSPLVNEPARIRFHPNVHSDAPFDQVGYNRLDRVKIFVMPTTGGALVPISGGAWQDINTHRGQITDFWGNVLNLNVWSPRNAPIPSAIYEPTNRVANGMQSQAKGFYSLGFVQGTNKSIITYHHIANGTDADNLSFAVRRNTNGFNTPTKLLDVLNTFTNDATLDNNNGLFTELARFAALNDINYDGNRFSYTG